MSIQPLKQSIAWGWRQMTSRPLYPAMFLVPLLVGVFYISLMDAGLPLHTPVGYVDLDHSSMSRSMRRSLSSSELLDITGDYESFHRAMEDIESGRIYGFFMVPYDYQRKLEAGMKPTLSFYFNLSYFIPGTLAFKGFTTTVVSTAGNIVTTKLEAVGATQGMASALIQPVAVDNHPVGNPWLNYNIYLTNSFIPAALALMIMIMTSFSICEDIKRGRSPQWIAQAGGSLRVALIGKLLPQGLVWEAVGMCMLAIFYGYCHFPLNNHAGHMILAMALLVPACQAFALMICEIVPNLRLALSLCSLIGILSFSLAAFSFPVQSMYGAVGIFSYVLPIRYYYLIYIDQALNGIPIYYSRFYYVALLIFPLLSMIRMSSLRRLALNPVYIR